MILFLDTVSPLPEFSLIEKNNIIKSIQILNQKSNKISDCIIPAFLKMQKELQIKDNIKKLVVCTGPGSYTALRVGVAFMYGLSFSRKIPLIGITCTDLLNLALQESDVEKTLMFICSSNNQNFICNILNQKHKYFIKKLDNKLQSDSIDYTKYSNSISNYKLSSDILKKFNLSNRKEIKFAEIIRSNLQQVTSYPSDEIIDPIYISENKALN